MRHKPSHLRDQAAGGAAGLVNEERVRQLNEELSQINTAEASKLGVRREALADALGEVKKARSFLDEPILGSPKTKHGEIAEAVEVRIRNARDYVEGNPPNATFEGVGRTAPEDYLVGGTEVQSKFINGLNNNLEHVLNHMDKYSNFGRDGSYYHIPNDHYQRLTEVIEGKIPEGMASRSVRAIQEKIRVIEEESGRSFSDVVKPAISDYGDVQQGVIRKTLDGHEQQLTARNEEIKDTIKQDATEDRQATVDGHQPSLGEAAKVGLLGAAIGGTFSVGLAVYRKVREGKSVMKFTAEDWKDLGVDFAKGSAKGGITGLAVYGLTNCFDMGAPMASAFVSATYGVASLARSYKQRKITWEEFVEQGQVLCFDSGVVALGATIGQAAIPIPIVGALVGTFASKALLSISKDYLGKETQKLSRKIDREYKATLAVFDKAYQRTVEQIVAEYERLGEITAMAFNFDRNAMFRLDMSIKLALEHGVAENVILKTEKEINDFMLS